MLFVLVFFIGYNLIVSYLESRTELSITYKIANDDKFQVFYDNNTKSMFDEKSSVYFDVIGGGNWNELQFWIPYKNLKSLRIDLGQLQNEVVEIGALKASNYFGTKVLTADDILKSFTFFNAISAEKTDQSLLITKNNEDMYFYTSQFDWEIKTGDNPSIWILAIVVAAIVAAGLFFIYKFSPARELCSSLYQNRKIMISLSYNDFKTKYTGSYLGIIWAFIQPIITVMVYIFVFSVGFRSRPLGGVPFVNWLTAGILPWLFFSDAWTSGSGCLMEYNYLVKKVVFNINILPIVKVLSSLYVHLFFLAIVIALFLFTGYMPDIYWLQIFYYCACTFLLAAALAYLTSALILFLRDLGQIISIFLQVGIWLTPIMWESHLIPSQYLWLMKLNPMFYVVQGYRNSFIYKVWFWESFAWTIYFAVVTLGILIIGLFVFKKLKPHFADVF